LEIFDKALEALNLLNKEFLSRCCRRLSKEMLITDDEYKKISGKLTGIIDELSNPQEKDDIQ
jgi:hypothetical protein